MKMTWLHMQFVLIFVTGPSQSESGTDSLALTVKLVILKPLKDSTSSVLHNLLPQNCTNVITGGNEPKESMGDRPNPPLCDNSSLNFYCLHFGLAPPPKRKVTGQNL